jgi:hypothetical protein
MPPLQRVKCTRSHSESLGLRHLFQLRPWQMLWAHAHDAFARHRTHSAWQGSSPVIGTLQYQLALNDGAELSGNLRVHCSLEACHTVGD